MQKKSELSKWLLVAAFAASSTAFAACGSDDEDNGGGTDTDTGSDAGTDGSGAGDAGTDGSGSDDAGTDDTGGDGGGGDGGGDDTGTGTNTIVDVAAAAGNFTTLLAAAEAAGLVETLSGDAPLTVFAPTDEAFAALPEGTVDALLADPEALAEILLYHVVAGEVPSSAVTTGPVTTVSGFSAWLAAGDGVTINNATVTAADVEADNGVIHVIDQVILPPNLVEFASYTGEFDTLLTAAGAAGIDGLLTTEGPFTVFAPTDDAFAALPAGTLDALLADTDALTGVLTYHAIVGAAVEAADVEPGFIATAAEGLSAVIHTNDEGGLAINNANIVITDIITTNGVVHVIDAVILPSTIGELASYADDYSTLFTAVGAADPAVAAALTDPSASLTLFAPNNDAFAAIPEADLNALLADTPALSNVLLYHVIPAAVPAEAVTAGFVTTAADLSAYIGTEGGVTINDATVTATDILATNGVIHAIDGVILPQDLAGLVTLHPDLSTLLTAVGAADEAVLTALTNPAAELTLFAPVNDAFAALPAGALDGLLADQAALTDVLLYHVFDGLVDAAAAVAAVGTNITMLNGDAAAVASPADGVLTVDGATVVITDVNATNGIIHVISGVMLP